jgi:sterol desaturase/sphingolipid hydroxylase (fatty acid hydroxylase superfamily)
MVCIQTNMGIMPQFFFPTKAGKDYDASPYLERLAPFRGDARLAARQARNLALVLVDTALLRLLFPLLAVGAAVWARANGAGLFNHVDWPAPLELLAAFLALDLAIYFQHRLMHAVPLLWRLHRMHHSDIAFDVTTGVRFHPLEIALSMLIKLALVVALGADPLAVLAFEVVLSAGSLFTHADVALPARAEPFVRALVVTPSMHRVHHSTLRVETDSNFGFNLSCWDRLFGSYRAAPSAPERTMTIGLDAFRAPAEQTFLALLLQPLREPENTHA